MRGDCVLVRMRLVTLGSAGSSVPKMQHPFGFNVWQITVREFKDAFTDYANSDRAHQDLLKLRMKEGRLDEYVSKFQDLANRARLELNELSALRMFAQGLQGTLAHTCIFQDSPENFAQWVQSAQQNHRNWLKVHLKEHNPFQQRRPGTNPFTWRRNNGPAQSNRPVRCDPDAMDVDAIPTSLEYMMDSNSNPWPESLHRI